MLLHTEHLTKSYNGFRALDDLNLTVTRGEVVGLLGPNGSGKTTALRLILGFLRPTTGHATVAGHDCWADSVRARRHVSYLPGELRLYENMTGRQLVRFLGELRGDERRADVDALARRFDIDLDRPIAHLSSGMKRKVALLQVLVPHAPLLILDEPTNTLDPTMRDELLAQLRQARDGGQAVVFSSHVLGEVEQVCDRVAVVDHGKVIASGSMDELLSGSAVRVHVAGLDQALRNQLAAFGPVDAEGDQLTFTTLKPDRVPELVSKIVSLGGRVYEVVPRHTTLEDRFLQLLQAEEH